MRNQRIEKEAKRLLSKIAKSDLSEMSIINDHILAEGVENLESESGRARFFENLKTKGLNCSRETLNSTIEGMKEDNGQSMKSDDCIEAEIREGKAEGALMVNMIGSIYENRGFDARDYTPSSSKEGASYLTNYAEANHAIPYYKVLNLVKSEATLPTLLSNMVDAVSADIEDAGRKVTTRPDLDIKELERKHEKIKERVERLALLTSYDPSMSLQVKAKGKKVYGLRSSKKKDYSEEAKTLPNWKKLKEKNKSHPINSTLEKIRRPGYGVVEVRESLVPGDSG
jgi:hypothetical protein